MTKVKLVNGTIINAESVELVNGVLRIATTELSVEELASLFSNDAITNCITLMTESGKDFGYKTGFTSFAGIQYLADGVKVIEMFQPIDEMAKQISTLTGLTSRVENDVNEVKSSINSLFGVEV